MLTGMIQERRFFEAEVISLFAILALGYLAVLAFAAAIIKRFDAPHALLLFQSDPAVADLDPFVNGFTWMVTLVLVNIALFGTRIVLLCLFLPCNTTCLRHAIRNFFQHESLRYNQFSLCATTVLFLIRSTIIMEYVCHFAFFLLSD